MKFMEYIKGAKETAIYPGQGTGTGMGYAMFGMCGEIGECFEIAKKILRDDKGIITEEKRNRFFKEIGDVFWYVSQVIVESNIKLDIFDYTSEKFQELACTDMVVPEGQELGHIGTGLIQSHFAADKCLFLYTQLCAEKDDDKFTELLIDACKSVVNVMESMIRVIVILGGDLDIVLQGNLDKLSARKEAGVLTGSGETLEERS